MSQQSCHRFDGEVAIVTGGASGIGAATARRLVAEGARVAIADIDGARAEALAKEFDEAAIGLQFDAGDVASVEAVVARTVDHFGRLDLLHNNAAIMAPEHIARDTNPVDIEFDVWDRTMAVNLRGYLAGCKFAIPHMLARGKGAIVMTASGSGNMGDLATIAYGTSKAAIIGMNRYVATIYGKQGIRCNVVNPGLIRTEGGKRNVFGPDGRDHGAQHPRPVSGSRRTSPPPVVFLLSDDAAFITGAELDVDGGMLCHAPYMTDVLQAYGAGQAFGGEGA